MMMMIMRRTRDLSNLPLFFLLLRMVFMDFTWALPPNDGCPLNFTNYPYLPSGECISDGAKDRIKDWDSLSTTRCCRNGLDSLTQALALNANLTDSLFLPKQQWSNCDNGSFNRQQPSLSIKSCNFDDLYFGSSGCSNITFSNYKWAHHKQYKEVVGNCSQFEFSGGGGTFDDACGKCTAAIAAARDEMLYKFDGNKNGSLRAICGVVVVISAVVEHIGDPEWVGDFYRCLVALDIENPGYIKVKYSIAKALLAILVAAMALMLVVVVIKYVTTKKHFPKPLEGKDMSAWSGVYRFSRTEIMKAINFGNHKVCLGTGSAGRVYKGVLPSGQVVAIKHIYKSNMSDSFTREVEGLSRIRHPNLVCLFGCCIEDGEQYLVYEYCSSGNLAQHLLKRDTGLTWDRRVKILRDCALALRFLHTYPYGCIVHRDIKLTNILLTEDMEPKLSDFGLAKMLGMEESKVFTDVRGTLGYMDPEYMSNAKLTSASDVYSFGIVILQLLSGRKVIELDIDARDQLTRKAKDVIMGKRPLTDFEDPRLNGDLNVKDFKSILHIAVLCVAKSSKGRPTIDVVLQEIEDAWKNTESYVQEKNEGKYPSATPLSNQSSEVISV